MPRKGWNSVTIDEETKKILEIASKETGRSQSDVAKEAILRYVRREAGSS